MNTKRNRKLLVSVFNSQEAREAVLGGGRIIDSEDPSSALGNIKPRQISQISNAVLHYKRDTTLQLSTNIGEDQWLYDRNDHGEAIAKSTYEISGKSAQAAIGVTIAMGTQVHPCPIVKVGVDGMPVELLTSVLHEVVITLKQNKGCETAQVMSVLFAQDRREWDARKKLDSVRTILVGSREYDSCDTKDPDGFDIRNHLQHIQDTNGRLLVTSNTSVELAQLKTLGLLPAHAKHTLVKLRELHPHAQYFPDLSTTNRTNIDVIKAMVDATAKAGAGAIMLDTRIQSKEAHICSVDTSSDGLIDINQFDYNNDALARTGIMSLEELKFFVEYCHYRNIEANIAGSVQSYQAQQLWLAIPELDQISTRGAASCLQINPATNQVDTLNTRQHRIIHRHLVRGLTPPEQEGVLNFPAHMRKNPVALEAIAECRAKLNEQRRQQKLPELISYFVDAFGHATEIT